MIMVAMEVQDTPWGPSIPPYDGGEGTKEDEAESTTLTMCLVNQEVDHILPEDLKVAMDLKDPKEPYDHGSYHYELAFQMPDLFRKKMMTTLRVIDYAITIQWIYKELQRMQNMTGFFFVWRLLILFSIMYD